jgi:hypothetical protein
MKLIRVKMIREVMSLRARLMHTEVDQSEDDQEEKF